MALRETVGAEAFNLAKAALSEIPLIATGHHAFDHLRAEILDRPNIAERRH